MMPRVARPDCAQPSPATCGTFPLLPPGRHPHAARTSFAHRASAPLKPGQNLVLPPALPIRQPPNARLEMPVAARQSCTIRG
ncbi:protein of unknown function [Paraburkholderia kururiensis]